MGSRGEGREFHPRVAELDEHKHNLHQVAEAIKAKEKRGKSLAQITTWIRENNN